MRLSQLFKLHFYAYFIWYIIFTVLTALSYAVVALFFTSNANFLLYFTIILIVISFIFSLFIGIYEYSSLSYTYLNLKISRSSFFFSSIIHAILNALFLTLIFAATSAMSSIVFENSMFPYLKVTSFALTMTANILFYLIGSVFSLLLQNIKHIKMFIYLILLVVLALFADEIIAFTFTNLQKIYVEVNNLVVYLPAIVTLTIVLIVIEYLSFRTKDIKK